MAYLKTLLLAALFAPSAAKFSVLPSLSDKYKEKVKNFRESTTKDDFIKQMDSDSKTPLSGKQADRMWDYLEAQLHDGRVIFKDDGSMKFSTPPLQPVAPYLPAALVDSVEFVVEMLRQFVGLFYNQLPGHVHDKHNDMVEWLNDSGTIHLVLGGLFAFIGMSFLRCLYFRLTADSSPEIKRKAAEYDEMMKKKGQ